jgi:hypothetical protein
MEIRDKGYFIYNSPGFNFCTDFSVYFWVFIRNAGFVISEVIHPNRLIIKTMSPKPNDLFLGVIEFFGILIPGAVLVFMHGDFLLKPFGWKVGTLQTASDWIPAFFISYILGHFLLGFSVPFNRIATFFLSKNTKAYFNTVRDQVELPHGLSPNYSNVFYSAYSYVRIHSPNALIELDRQAAEYKLFRSLILLFLLDIPLCLFTGSCTPQRIMFSLLFICLTAYRFDFLFDWTYQLAYDFYLQLQAPRSTPENKSQQ